MKSQNSEQLVLGLVGNAASGKDFVASVFVDNGFIHYSTSDVVREEIQARGQTTSRELQTAVANEVRATNGVSYFVEESLRRINQTSPQPEKVLLSGLYAPAEGKYIIDELGGKLVSVVASEEPAEDVSLRFDRLLRRADGPRDDLNHSDFIEAYERENSGVLPVETNVAQLIKMAAFSILNTETTTPQDLDSQVQGILRRIT